MKNIENQTDYNSLMEEINSLMSKGSGGLSAKQLDKVRKLAESAQQYEQRTYKIEAPETLLGMIEMRQFELKLRQKQLARLLDVSDAKLSLIMNGKQKPGVEFLKAVHQKLNIDANFILEHA